jgi:hypothetical protein
MPADRHSKPWLRETPGQRGIDGRESGFRPPPPDRDRPAPLDPDNLAMTVPMLEGLYEQHKHYPGVTPAVKIGGGGAPAEPPQSDEAGVENSAPEPRPVRVRTRRRWWQRTLRGDIEVEASFEVETEVWLDGNP